MNARKISASLPGEQYRAMEHTRRKYKLRRSQVVQEAVQLWLNTREQDERVRRYLQAYASQPEDIGEAKAVARAWAKGLPREDWG